MRLWALAATAALSLCACGSAGKLTCSDDAACGDGRKCARTVAGESHGVCVADYGLAFRSPADQALLTAGSVPITVELTLGSVTQAAPQTLELMVDGKPAGTLNLSSRTDRVASYVGSLTLESGQTASLEAVAAAGTLDEVRAGPVRVTGKSTPPPPPPPPPPPDLPKVSSVGLACQAGAQLCVRDEEVAVAARVENAPTTVRVSTDLAPGYYYTLSNIGGGTDYAGTIPLSRTPFPAFTMSMTATVEAFDATGSVVSSKTAQVTVTRLRWAYPTGVAVTSPAVMDDGTLVVGLSKTTGQLLAVKPDASQAWATTLEAQSGAGRSVTSAPVVGKKAIWVGSDDGRIYGVKLDGSGLVPSGLCPAASDTATVGHLFTPLVYQLPGASGVVPEEAVYTGGPGGEFHGLVPSAGIKCVSPAYVTAETTMVSSPVMSSSGAAFFALRDPTRNADLALLYTLNSQVPAQLDYQDYVPLGGTPLSMGVDGSGALLVPDGAKKMNQLVTGSSATRLNWGWSTNPGSVQYGSEAMVVSSDGEPITGGKLSGPGGAGAVDRLTSAGKMVSGWPVSLGAGSTDVTGLALAKVDAAGVALYATTSAGDLFALDQNGAVGWSTRSGGTQPLGSGKLDFPTIAPAASDQTLPTLYTGSADGHLYAVVVDSGLDPESPWPKAHHDLRNTGNGMEVR
jgi:hypothetical protein